MWGCGTHGKKKMHKETAYEDKAWELGCGWFFIIRAFVYQRYKLALTAANHNLLTQNSWYTPTQPLHHKMNPTWHSAEPSRTPRTPAGAALTSS